VESIIQPKLNDDDLSVEDIARQVYLSKRHLNRLLKAECGMSVKEVLIEMRLQEAYRILQTEPGIVIKDVAFRIGYNKPSYFSKIFRQRFGISPREVMRYESKR
jgi:transcriptional regulator GlxA family with amidase domain